MTGDAEYGAIQRSNCTQASHAYAGLMYDTDPLLNSSLASFPRLRPNARRFARALNEYPGATHNQQYTGNSACTDRGRPGV